LCRSAETEALVLKARVSHAVPYRDACNRTFQNSHPCRSQERSHASFQYRLQPTGSLFGFRPFWRRLVPNCTCSPEPAREGLATKRHKKHKKLKLFCDFCAFLCLIFLFAFLGLTFQSKSNTPRALPSRHRPA